MLSGAIVVALVLVMAALLLEGLALLAPAAVRSALGPAHGVLVQGRGLTLLALVTMGLCAGWFLVQQRRQRRTRQHTLTLENALTASSIGIAVWDRHDRLLAANPMFGALYPEIAAKIRPGIGYNELASAYYDVADAAVRSGRTREQFIAAGAAKRHGDAVSEVVRRVGDRQMLMTDYRSDDGGVVSLRIDVTNRATIEAGLFQRRRVFEDLADITFDWFWRTDAEGRVAEVSDSLFKVMGYRPQQMLGLLRTELPGFEADPADIATYEARVRAREPFSWFHYRVRHAEGHTVWVAVAGRPVFAADGTFRGYYGVGRDVTERASAMAAVRRSEQRFRALTALASEWFWETDAALCFTAIKGPPGMFEDLQSKLLGKPVSHVLAHRNFHFEGANIEQFVAQRRPFRRQPMQVERDTHGRRAYYEVSAEPMFEGETFVGYHGLSWDVTEREALLRQISASESRFRALTELSSDWYWEMDAELRFTEIRRGPGGRLELTDAQLIGRHRWELPGELLQPASWDEHRATLLARKPFRDLIIRRLGENGTAAYTLTSGDPVLDAEGRFVGYRGIGKNISDQVRAQERIERLATIDPLTQLFNRQTFDEAASRVLSNAYADGKTCALLFIDLDNFRLLNNGYGHRVGDQVLATVASRLRTVVGESHLYGRRGGDELVVLLNALPRTEVAAETAQALIRAVSEPMRLFGMEVTVTPSVGISFFPQDGVDLDSLLNAADAAMYQAKESGRRTYAHYTSSVARRVDLRLRLEQRLRKAVEARDFRLFYQPLVSLADGKMMGAEALIRWKDVELGDISPAEFIPIAEESGLIVGLGDWVIREAARARQVWRQLGLDVPPVALNFSGVQLRQIGCVEGLLDVLQQYEVNPGEIEVEVTETGLLDTTAVARENLIRLRNAGVRLALDDFGVGFSSLAHLRDLPIHRLKIDRSFTVECMRDARTLTIVKAVIEMARSLGISVTAEGIETQAQQTWMQHLGCDTAQGYLFSRPMPADEFLKLFLDKRGVGRERSLMH